MARSRVTERDLGYDRIMRETKKLSRTEVTVGIQSDAGSDEEGVRNVDKAFWNEFGTENIPTRSFVRAAFDENREDLDNVIDRLWNGVKQGKVDARRAAGVLGQRHEDQVKQKATTGPFVPNSPVTVALKGSSAPLVDTGEMVNSIRYEVKS